MTNPVRTAIVTIEQGKPMCSSRHVAAMFGKRHADVLRDVDHLIEQAPEAERNFALCPYKLLGKGRSYRAFNMTKDGFTLLAMGFTGKEALRFKLAYIERFNQMEESLRTTPLARNQPLGRTAVRLFHYDGLPLRALASEAGARFVAADVVRIVYESARESPQSPAVYLKGMVDTADRVVIGPLDVPELFHNQHFSQLSLISEAGFVKLVSGTRPGRGGTAMLQHKRAVKAWLQSDVLPSLPSLPPATPSAVRLEDPATLRQRAAQFIEAAEALEAVEAAKERASRALSLVA